MRRWRMIELNASLDKKVVGGERKAPECCHHVSVHGFWAFLFWFILYLIQYTPKELLAKSGFGHHLTYHSSSHGDNIGSKNCSIKKGFHCVRSCQTVAVGGCGCTVQSLLKSLRAVEHLSGDFHPK